MDEAHAHVIGTQPDISGAVCEAIICEAFEASGELVTASNVVFVRVAAIWHRLLIDAGVVFWRKQPNEPMPWAVPEKGWNYPHRNVGKEFKLEGLMISSVASLENGGKVFVEFHFADGRKFVLVNENDKSTFEII